MLRIFVDCSQAPFEYRFLDSVNAAIVAALSKAGAPSEALTGPKARPWTFGVRGFSRRGGVTRASGLTISSPDDVICAAIDCMKTRDLRKTSSNGDVVNLEPATKRAERRQPHPEISEIMLNFASPFAIMKKKAGKERSLFYDQLSDVDLSSALVAGLKQRSGRALELDFATDPITRIANGRARLVSTRLSGSRRILIPAFSAPITVRGAPEDIRFAYFAGLGAKTRGGFGCPILTS